jgi:2-polyprenyl-3-methyl-5-hydroxy-6-metoxy-1,4-benzoquinol methylase
LFGRIREVTEPPIHLNLIGFIPAEPGIDADTQDLVLYGLSTRTQARGICILQESDLAKANEIDYVREVARKNAVKLDDFQRYLLNKPFSDPRCCEYLMDVAQIMALLPPAPRKLLDVGAGSGWTSELFAKAGYQVLGLDISGDMIDLAKQRNCSAEFMVSDYEVGPIPGKFDVAVIYDALHHADNERLVIKNVFDALSDDGVFITVEPGVGHSKTADSIQAMEKYGTTEKDMPFHHQRALMMEVGFDSVEQYVRMSQAPSANVASMKGSLTHIRHGFALAYATSAGLTSIAVARKGRAANKARFRSQR